MATNANAAASAAAPASRAAGEHHVVDRSHKGEPAPAIAFTAPGGKPAHIADAAGKPVLVNLWATWCGPCVGELPTLNRLAATTRVMAVAQDLDGAMVAPFLQTHKAGRLTAYVDSQTALSIAYQASLPTSILYDSQGREVWRVVGAMNWTSPAATALLAEAGA